MLIKRFLYYSYARLLSREVKRGTLPVHIGLILDGNRRYAREMGYDDLALGHKEGAKKLDDVLKWCVDLGIRIVTIWVLSTDNVQRDKDEVASLLKIIEEKIEDLSKNPVIRKYGFQIRAFGNLEALPDELKEAIRESEISTRDYSDHILNIAIGYGGREEIVDAVKKAIKEKKATSIEKLADSICMDDITSHLYMRDIPDPDLIIRTSGEIRLSGFLLWQSAYSEFYFCDALWPAFRKIDFLRAIRSYQHRNRRFGR
ncbi:MAG: (2Z,6E)-farnesyl diphosphate synthase [Syntrophorhabdus sp. PtaU1.Bin002]|nr:MAG: (2Z,6E)-farnesyl diphosphate synthase [Syntrophorhabdus sp. PtaB.Bin006]OPY69195.1 MAG: (2Z,6E)-farnesyl diphosphate synthase [Syntrophorhabdus sp. PtaU1.Bin002]